MRDPSLPSSVVFTIRVDPEAVEILRWHAEVLGYNLRGLIRDALETVADDILAANVTHVDPALPDTVLLKRLRHRFEVTEPSPDGQRSETLRQRHREQ